jgi:hypothetical protein
LRTFGRDLLGRFGRLDRGGVIDGLGRCFLDRLL